MEDVLETYQKPRDPDRPLVCLDETSKQLIVETRASIPAKPGRAVRPDSSSPSCSLPSEPLGPPAPRSRCARRRRTAVVSSGQSGVSGKGGRKKSFRDAVGRNPLTSHELRSEMEEKGRKRKGFSSVFAGVFRLRARSRSVLEAIFSAVPEAPTLLDLEGCPLAPPAGLRLDRFAHTKLRRPEMAPQPFEKSQFAPGNGMASNASDLQDVGSRVCTPLTRTSSGLDCLRPLVVPQPDVDRRNDQQRQRGGRG